MRTLYLHIGQGKTGTSYIQTVLALSRVALKKRGIMYPVTSIILKNLANNLNAGGNGLGLCNAFDHFPALETIELPKKGDVLFSYEGFISRLMFEDSDLELDRLCERHNFDAVSFLVLCRNPVSHVVSSYRQLVKRSGMKKTLNEYCKNFNSPRQLARFIERYKNKDNYKIRIRNYSECSDDLIVELEDWLSVPSGDFSLPQQSNINRSLTLAELMFQLELNKHLGDQVEIFADPLFETLPRIKPEELFPGLKVQQGMIERLRDSMQIVNEFMDKEGHHYQEDLTRPKGRVQLRETYSFTGKQLAALAAAYAKAVDK